MASQNSFDIVSELNQTEVANAVDQSQREIGTRYDFKGTVASVEHDKKENTLTLMGENESQLDAIRRVLLEKFIKRGIEGKALDPQKPEPASGAKVRQVVKLRSGIDKDSAKVLTKKIKEVANEQKLKVNASIQGDTVRVQSAKRDDLQTIIQALREDSGVDVPLQFTNYR